MGASGRVQTYGELDAAANRFSHELRAAGLEVGDHIALCVENHPDFLALAWGAHYAGLLYTACSTRLTSGELAYVVDDAGARVLVLSARQAGEGRRARRGDAEGGAALLARRPDRRLRAARGRGPPQPATPLEARRAGSDMLYSSGTTGRPKGSAPSGAPAARGVADHHHPVLRDVLGFGPGDVYLSPAPLYHAAPLRFCMGVHQLGGTVVVMERFDPAALLDLVARHRVTHAQLVPTMFVRLLRLAPRSGRPPTSPRCAPWSTPPRRARRRSSARCSTGGARSSTSTTRPRRAPG
jgi:acyl-CoA synthetase (AMP-forming)/AMP-acid ligase II